MSAANQLPAMMTVAEFLTWTPPDGGDRWELIDGVARAMAPAAPRHGAIQNEIGRLMGNHLAELRSVCRVVTEPGIRPQVGGNLNVRIPHLAVNCAPPKPHDRLLREPIVVIEILLPSNERDSRANVWSFTTIPSVRELLTVHTAEIRADLLRREDDSTWPDNPLTLTVGDAVTLESIDFTAPIAAFYRTA
jgi:Uma2 family endonuclease